MTNRAYLVTVGDFEPFVYEARSPAAAKWRAFVAYDDVYRTIGEIKSQRFRRFLAVGVSVRPATYMEQLFARRRA